MVDYEKMFAKSDKTDAILVVGGRKLHVNKAFLSYHSDYFDKLFNGDFKEKSMPEIPIEDVNFEHFATLLSLVHPNPVKPKSENAEKLLELADRFLLTAAKSPIELYLSGAKNVSQIDKFRIADKYQLDDLLQETLNSHGKVSDFREYNYYETKFQMLSDRTKVKILERIMNLVYFGRYTTE